MSNSVDPDQTAYLGGVGSGSTLILSILRLVSNVRQLLAADDFSRRHFSDAFYLDALRVIVIIQSICFIRTDLPIFIWHQKLFNSACWDFLKKICSLLNFFFKINFIKYFFQEYHQSVKHFGSRPVSTFWPNRPDRMSVLISVQTSFQRLSADDTCSQRVN